MNGSPRPISAQPSGWRPRQRLDRYELIGEIARGGMGTVLLARLAGAGGFSRLFAIKLLHPHLAADHQFVDMLLDEARLASRIHHSNAVPIVDVCQGALGPYVVMDYVDGFPFSKILGSQALSPDERLRIGVQALLCALGGLDAAHNLTDDDGAPLGLVHRDVSPQNLLVGIDGVARIADFGIAHAGTRLTHTEPGTVKGKTAYMAPEQARGEHVDRRADVFGVGVMLWECLTGRRLFRSATEAETLYKLLQAPIVPPSQVRSGAPVELDAVCLRALAREVGNRYATAREMAAELSRAADKAGCLSSSIEAADLIRSRFSKEITARQTAIRAHGAALTSGSASMLTPSEGGSSSGRPSGLLGSDPGLPRAWDDLSASGEVLSISAMTPSERMRAPSRPARERRSYARAAALAVALILLAAVAGVWLRPRRATVEPSAVTAPAAPATSSREHGATSGGAVTANGATAPTPSARGVTPQGAPASAGSRAATGAAAGADPANSPSASGAADATDKQAGAATPGDKRRLHGGHIDTNGHTRSGNPPPRDQPVLEENPYLHR